MSVRLHAERAVWRMLLERLCRAGYSDAARVADAIRADLDRHFPAKRGGS